MNKRLNAYYHIMLGLLSIVLLVVNCAHRIPLTPAEQAQMEKEARQEQFQTEKEAKRIDACVKHIYFIDENNIKASYNLVDVISDTERNGYINYSLNYLKQKACEEGANALITPTIYTGPRRTTVTSKAIVIITSTTLAPEGK